MAEQDVIKRKYTYPDDKYEGGLGVDDKEPSVKWLVPGKPAIAEVFNWAYRKIYEDSERILSWISKFGATQTLDPFNGLMPTQGNEPQEVIINDYFSAFDMNDIETTEVRGDARIVRTNPSLILYWSMPNVGVAEEAELNIDIDIYGTNDSAGSNVISTTTSLSVPNNSNQRQATEISLDLSGADDDGDGWADIRGDHMGFYVKRDPSANGSVHLHGIEVK